MKNLTSLVCFVLLFLWGLSSSGQSTQIKKGDEAYKLKNYAAAIDYYTKAYDKLKGNLTPGDTAFVRKLANSYKFTNQYEKASEFYDILLKITNREIFPGSQIKIGDNFEYADMLLRSGDFKGAKAILKTLERSDDTAVVRMIRSCDFAESELKKKLPEVFVENMATINSPGSDFGLGKNNDALVFASNRINTKQSVLDGVYNQEFTDLYTASKFPGTIYYGNPEIMKGEINTEYNDGTFTRAPGKNWALTTQCVKNPVHCSIYRVTLSGDKWVKREIVKTDLPGYNYGHPTLSSDGKTVYFSSDKPLPNKKGKNIWKAKYNYFTNVIDQALPAGDNINTDRDEMFPYLFRDSILFFASSGLVGMGGLDLYWSVIRDGFYDNPVNMGAPVNSTADDFSIIMNDNMRGGYFCSNRGFEASDDIYYTNKSIMEPIYVKVLDALTNKRLENVSISNQPDKELTNPFTKLTDKKGIVALNTGHLPCDLKEHGFKFQISDYEPKTELLPCNSKDTITVKLDPVGPQPPYTLRGNVYDSISRKPIFLAKVVMSYDGKPQAETLTNEKGDYYFDNVPRNKRITLTVSKDNYYRDEKTFDSPSTKNTFEISKKTGYNTDFGLHPFPPPPLKLIFYDYDKFFLRNESVVELDKLVRIFTLNPELNISIESHCDERGSNEYNIRLSERRGMSVRNYLISRGIDPSRLKLKNFGKSKPAVPDAKTEEDHQQNRRTEFIPSYINPEGSVLPAGQDTQKDATIVGNNEINRNNEVNKKTEENINPTTKQVPQPNISFTVTSSENPKDTVISKGKKADVMIDDAGNLIDKTKTEAADKTTKSVQPGKPVYRVQIAASSKTVNVNSQFPTILDIVKKYGVNVEKVSGLNKYQIGNFASFEEADNVRVLLKAKGLKDCFVVVLNK